MKCSAATKGPRESVTLGQAVLKNVLIIRPTISIDVDSVGVLYSYFTSELADRDILEQRLRTILEKPLSDDFYIMANEVFDKIEAQHPSGSRQPCRRFPARA